MSAKRVSTRQEQAWKLSRVRNEHPHHDNSRWTCCGWSAACPAGPALVSRPVSETRRPVLPAVLSHDRARAIRGVEVPSSGTSPQHGVVPTRPSAALGEPPAKCRRICLMPESLRKLLEHMLYGRRVMITVQSVFFFRGGWDLRLFVWIINAVIFVWCANTFIRFPSRRLYWGFYRCLPSRIWQLRSLYS